jgi:hypothetical protein
MKTQFEEYRSRRQRTGAVTLICLISALGGFLFAEPGSAWVAAALRIGIVFGALWLCFPTRTRPAAWAFFSPVRLVVIAVSAYYFHRIKWLLPFLAILAILLSILRPRVRK